MEEARRLLLDGLDDVRVGVADVEAADAAAEVEERVPIDVGERRAAALGGDDREIHGQRRGDHRVEAGEDLAGARPRNLRLQLDRADGSHDSTISASRPGRPRYDRDVVLSDVTIARALSEGRIEIDPYDDSLLQPSSVDVRVDRLFRVFHNNRYPYIDVKQEQEELTELVRVEGDTPFVLHPGEFVLGSTLERIRLPDDLVARLEGKSSLGRLGLLIHSTAGFIDPGWDGHVTLELSNVATLPITIYPGMKIGQISFMQMTEPAAAPYGSSSLGSKYKGQEGPTPSRYYKNFE
jgi:dCTP deaminase